MFQLDTSRSTHTHTHPLNGPFSGTTRVSWYQKGKTNLDFTEARDSEWQWHQMGRIQVCTSLQTDNHASTPSLSFLQARCPSCRSTNSVEALKASRSTWRQSLKLLFIWCTKVTHCAMLVQWHLQQFHDMQTLKYQFLLSASVHIPYHHWYKTKTSWWYPHTGIFN